MSNKTKRLTPLTRLAAQVVSCAAMLAVCGQASATHVINAKIVTLRVTEWHAMFVFVDQAPQVPAGTSTPACVTTPPSLTAGSSGAYALDISTPGGKAMMNQLQIAKATNKRVTIVGRGSFPASFPSAGAICNVWGGFETVNYIDVDE